MAMAVLSSLLLVLAVTAALLRVSIQFEAPSPCGGCGGLSRLDTGVSNTVTQHRRRLRTLGAELAWSYYGYGISSSTNGTQPNVTVDVEFTAVPGAATGWVAWGVTPGRRPGMVGTRALIAFIGADGAPVVHTYSITAYTKLGCRLEPSPIDVKAENLRANLSGATGAITVAATLSLHPAVYNITRLGHAWQVGSLVDGGQAPLMHPLKLKTLDSYEIIDLTSGRGFRERGLANKRIAHGVMSVIGWGILLPLGVMVKRYSEVCTGKPHDLGRSETDEKERKKKKRWFMLHVALQLMAYIVGAAAWAIGIALMSNSRHFKSFSGHRTIGIVIFSLATLQITALCLKPKPKPAQAPGATMKNGINKRKKWNMFHHIVGYALVALTITNIFKGFAILEPPEVWKWIYVGMLAAIGCVVLGFELSTWVREKKLIIFL